MKGHLRGEPEGQHSTLWKGVIDAQGGIALRGGDRPDRVRAFSLSLSLLQVLFPLSSYLL